MSAGVSPASVRPVGSAPGRQEQLDQLDVAVLGRGVQRREPAVLGGVDVGAGRDQQAADLDVPAGGGAVERLDLRRSLVE